jgi:group I intron endonuclease
MSNYNNGKIYVIRNHGNPLVYVGSTTQALSKRMVEHRSKSKSYTTCKLYQAFYEHGIEKFYIELVEDYPCESKEQLLRQEGHFIRQFDSYNNGYNGVIAGQTKKGYREDNRKAILEQKKGYRESNKDSIAKQKKSHYEANKEAIAEQKKGYYEANKEAIAKQKKGYREANREAIAEQKKGYREAKKRLDDVPVLL